MRAGKLNKLLQIEYPGGTTDSVGQRTTTWTLAAVVWGSIIPVKAETRLLAAQGHASTTHRIRVRASNQLHGIDGSCRVVYGCRVFTIDGIINVDERNREYELLCTEGLRDG